MVKYNFSGQAALVTGAGSGMGLTTAKAFAEAGASVAMADINDGAKRAAEELSAAGHNVIAINCDVADEDQVRAMIEQTVSTFGRLDFAFNNAGVMQTNKFTSEMSSEEWDRVQSVNLRGVWLCLKYELKHMEQQGSGSVVNCSSVGGFVTTAGLGGYISSKHGVIGLTKTAAVEYAPKGIRVNAVCPGTIRTSMVESMLNSEGFSMEEFVRLIPLGRLGRPEEISNAVLWLCSSDASYMIGHALPIDGGLLVI
ncbi:SDR family NAD(P)-dependent oxidoreductase [Flavobacterium pectinovorum]|uniref:NAD(P)-dependent dehydrogenase, short-chain alcohol dehydrogenase family n=1 Tax=Flavobacterium pectinovorum TaxID=29533 RepID=A0AB36P673_9FLAO|nr:glucose 1-dehydrogenase [Flavobacterium pectinovorum]OXB07823.1 oxidoreductase [Flavobacterium pectinovorum]SHM81637.1 NAD(P)-dependent dehydrogenase, short-chain alcohol dehydrogenase family [Flavobacterium pectinovorum]